jgi:hypothetical protein
VGFHSNQWLGKGMVNRRYRAVRVTIDCDLLTDGASPRLRFTAQKPNYEFQTLFLSQEEADEVAATVVSCMSLKEREKLIIGLLQDLSDRKLLRALTLDLKKRVPTLLPGRDERRIRALREGDSAAGGGGDGGSVRRLTFHAAYSPHV